MGRFARRRATCAWLLAIPVLACGTGSAGAAVVEREHFSGTDSFTVDDCDFPLEVESTFSGSSLIRETRGGEAFLGRLNITYRDVWTNPETGGSFVLRGRVLNNEIRATHVEGTIYEFEAIEAGQPFVIEDSDGNVIVRDRGVIRHTGLFDTLGDGMPSAEFIEGTAVVRGPHPGFAEDFPFCEIAADLTGA